MQVTRTAGLRKKLRPSTTHTLTHVEGPRMFIRPLLGQGLGVGDICNMEPDDTIIPDLENYT